VYRITRAFPDYERFGLANQMRRAVVSVSSNIAEGSSRESKKDFARFIQLAYGSSWKSSLNCISHNGKSSSQWNPHAIFTDKPIKSQRC